MTSADGLAGATTLLVDLSPPRGPEAAPTSQGPNPGRHQQRPHQERVEQEAGDDDRTQLLDEGYLVAQEEEEGRGHDQSR